MSDENKELNDLLEFGDSSEFEESKNIVEEAVERIIDNLEENSKKVLGHCQFSRILDNQYTPCGPTSDNLPPGVYAISKAHGIGLVFSKVPVKIENLINFPDSNSEKIIREIINFWEREHLFKNFGLPYKRGILLWGPQGSGKSSTIQLIIKDVIERDGAVLLFENPNVFTEGYREFRRIQPETPVVVIMEDLDEIIHQFSENQILQILDGVHRVHKTVFLACHSPDARILTRDLRWVPAKEIVAGDEIWALDEHPFEKTSLTGGKRSRRSRRSRRFKKGKVISSFTAMKECVRVHLDTGESFVCTVDHPWLSSAENERDLEWQIAQDLLERPNLCRPFLPWETDRSWEAGWLSCMLDNKGGVRYGQDQKACGVSLIQEIGKTADKIKEIASKYCDLSYEIEEISDEHKKQFRMFTTGGDSLTAELLGKVRAERLIEKFDFSGNVVQSNYPAKVVKVEPIGIQEIQSIETDVHTYFAEGFAVHNTTNYPQRLKARVVNRPSRFDKRFKIGFPNSECRKIYLESIKGDQDIDVDKWVRDTEDFSFAHLKELFVATKILGDNYEEALETLKSMRDRVATEEGEEFQKNKLGFYKKS